MESGMAERPRTNSDTKYKRSDSATRVHEAGRMVASCARAAAHPDH